MSKTLTTAIQVESPSGTTLQIGAFAATPPTNLMMSSRHFTPNVLNLGPVPTFDALSKAFLKAMPAEVRQIAKSRSPQQPIVVLTQVGYGIGCLAKHFFAGKGKGSMKTVAFFDNGTELGCAIAEHIKEGWLGEVDSTGRPEDWDWDDVFVPANVVMNIQARSPQHAYFRVVTGLADYLIDEDEENLKWAFEPRALPDDPDDEDHADFQKQTAIDRETPMLFIHLEGSNRLTWTIVKMRDVVSDAAEFCAHNMA